ncbi:MAG TPA: hypothetical protein PK520_03940, partial [Exilispira sp.]|nr:hypothetical protein [Exilispira sp.]
KQYIALLETEDVNISFTEDAIEALASISYEINSRTDNIGARRLHTVMEIVLEELLFNADKYSTQSIQIDRDYVNSKLCDIMEKKDLSKYIL